MKTRGIRNNNPLNIRHSADRGQGACKEQTDKSFVQFESMAYGYRAMFVLLNSYHKRYGLTTIREMISRWAPPSENFTEGYIRFVSERSGISADAQVDSRSERDMVPIVAAMSEIENGVKAVMSDVYEGWKLFSK